MNKIFACDVDGVVVDSCNEFYTFLSDLGFELREQYINADYRPYCAEKAFYITSKEYLNAFRMYWNSEDLYDHAVCRENSVECINMIKSMGFDVIFVSHVEGHHAKSKLNFLRKHFPVDGFFATREKHYVRSDIFVDDRLSNLVKQPTTTQAVLFDDRFLQGIEDTRPLGSLTVDRWDIDKFRELANNVLGR